jgi:hypothetical protein
VLDVAHSGGCGEHDYQMCWGGALEPGIIPEVHLKFSHFNHGDMCEAYLSKTLRYDLTTLYPMTGPDMFNVRVMTSSETFVTALYGAPGGTE